MTTTADPLVSAFQNELATTAKKARRSSVPPSPSAPNGSNGDGDIVSQFASELQAKNPTTPPAPEVPAPSGPPSPSFLDELETGASNLYHKAASAFSSALNGPQDIELINQDQSHEAIAALEKQRQQQQNPTAAPIADLGKLAQAYTEGTEFQQKHPYATGAIQAAASAVGSATSPENLAILGSFAAAPEVGIPGAIKRLVSAGWSYGQAKDAVQQLAQGYKSYRSGDSKTAGKMLGTGTANAAMAILGATYAARPGVRAAEAPTAEAEPEGVGLEDAFEQPQQPTQQPAPQPQQSAQNQDLTDRFREEISKRSAKAAPQEETQAPPIPSGVSTVGPKEEPLAAETPETLRAQTDALAEGTNPVVYIPKGQEGDAPPLPSGAMETEVPGDQAGAGTYYHTADISPEQIQDAAENGDHGRFLGFTQSKEEAIGGSQPAVIVARDANGIELKAAAVDAGNPHAVAAQTDALRQQFPKAASIGLEHPTETIKARTRPIETSKSEAIPGGEVKTGSRENVRTIHEAEGKLVESGRVKQEDIGRLRRAAMNQWEAQGKPGNLFEDFYARKLREATSTAAENPRHARSLEARRGEAGFVSGEMLRDIANGKIAKEAGQKITDDILKLGDKYNDLRKLDPEIADKLQTLDSAGTYFRAKAEANLRKVAGGLSRAQERLAALLADADSRENLRLNHPDEYRQALRDPNVMRAVEAYKPLAAELTQLRQSRGGQVLDRDYLRRVYEQHVAGVGSVKGKGTPEAGAEFDRVIRPSKPSTASREASAEYFHEHGIHEFGPSYGTKFTAEKISSLRDNISRGFMGKATRISSDAELPRSIEYNGQKFYRSDIAAEMKRGTPRYGVYDPNKGIRTAFVDRETGDTTFGRSMYRYLGPDKIVDALSDYDTRNKLGEAGTVRNFFRQQIVGFGFGIPHVANIERRIMQSFHGGVANPRSWAAAWKVAFDSGLKKRALKGVDDPRYDALLKNGGLSAGEIRGYKEYAGGNLNPANWAKFGHDLIFKQGGFDQRARLYVADLVKSRHPEIGDAELARELNKQLGDYNRANWTDRQKLLSKFMLFPGWDTASMRWALQHPIRTSVPPAVLTLLANQVINHYGSNKNEDQFDTSSVHIGDRAFNTNLARESMARTFYRPVLNFLQSKIEGESNQRAVGKAAQGIRQTAQGVAGVFNPLITGAAALAMNRQSLFSNRELFGKDSNQPGKILPTKGLDNLATLVVKTAFPALDRMLDFQNNVDLKSFVGGNLGVSNYKHDAEDRLRANAAASAEAYSTVSELAKKDPQSAREYLRDPDNAVLALFRNDFGQLNTASSKIAAARQAIQESRLSADEKAKRVKMLNQARALVLNRADVLDGALFGAKRQLRQRQAQDRRPMLPSTPEPPSQESVGLPAPSFQQ